MAKPALVSPAAIRPATRALTVVPVASRHSAATPGARSPSTARATPVLVLYGRDAGGKPHAATFRADEVDEARAAAASMGLKSAALEGGAASHLAGKLPVGKVFTSGKAFVPFVKGALYVDLVNALGTVDPTPPDPEAELAHETRAPSLYDFSGYKLPTDWGDIHLGHTVLAIVEPGEGWWEAFVVEVKEKDLFVLRWRDWPEDPLFVRRAHQLALLPAPARAAK